MAEYRRKEAREWAKEHMRGVCGCTMPTLSSSLRAVNERAIRHDIRREAELGFWGTLLVSECGTTDQEMRQVIDIGVDEARRHGIRTVLLTSFATLEDTLSMVRYGESAGVDLVLVSYPLTFYPRSEQEIYDYTRAVADSSDLGMILFCIGNWNFGRFHPSDFSPDLIERLVSDVENVVAIKNEIGAPGVAGIADVFRRFKDRVVVTDPFERNAPAWAMTFGMPFLGTSNYEYMGGEVPRYFRLLQQKRYDEAMDIYWRLQPARRANAAVTQETLGGSIVHRLLWKYEYWLNGFNGGPIRQPHLRLNDRQMNIIRRGLIESGIQPEPGENADFFVGRNPMD